VQNFKFGPNGFTLAWVKAEIEKILFNLPQVINKLMLNFMALYWPKGWKKKTRKSSNLGGQFANPKMLKVGPQDFFGPSLIPSVIRLRPALH
jgi:hypothetical protein